MNGLRLLILTLAFASWGLADVTYSIETVAGSDLVGDGAAAVAAQLSDAHGIAIDRLGNVYISDTDDHRVRKVSAAGVISTLAGTGHAGFSGDGGPAERAQLDSPYGMAADTAGNVYVADFGNQRVRKISPDGVIVTLAGTGQKGSTGDGGPAAAAQLMSPRNLVLDGVGNLYVSEFEGHRVRKIARGGTITTVAGTGVAGYNVDTKSPAMPAIVAQLAFPAGIAFDQFGSLYIADSRNNAIRRVTNGIMETVLDGRSGQATLMYSPIAVAVDAFGFLWVADNTPAVRELYGGVLRAMAGTGDAGYSGDGGPATDARLTGPREITFDSKGALYIADGRYVRKVAGGKISTVAGNGYLSAIGDGLPATLAQLKAPAGLALDADGNLLVADVGTQRIRKLARGVVTTVAGNGRTGYAGDGGPAVATSLFNPGAVAADAAGNLYIADSKNQRVRKVMAFGSILTAAGTGEAALGADLIFAPLAPLNGPRAVAWDPAGYVYIADTGNHRVARINPAGTLMTVAGNAAAGFAGDDGRANLAQLNVPSAVAVDGRGNVFIADTFNHRIRKVNAAGIITTVAGSGAAGFGGDGGPAASARLNFPAGVTVDAAGNLFIADTWNHRIRKMTPDGVMHTIAGTDTAGYKGDAGPASSAQLNFPSGIVADREGNVYLSDTFNNRVRKLTPQAEVIAPEPILDVVVVNAASLQPGPVAPGEIVTIFAAGIGPEVGVGARWNGSGTLETNLAETQVLFDGTPAALFYAQSGQVNVQVPYTVAGATIMESIYRSTRRLRLTLAVTDAAPGIFAGAILNEDGRPNSETNPAPRTTIITLYATGEGHTDPAGTAGKPAQAPYPKPLLPVAVKIGGYFAEVLYAGEAPGFVGLMQVNARVPGGFMPTGNLELVVTVGTAASQPGVKVAVR